MNSVSHRISRAHEWSSVMDATRVVLMKKDIQASNLASLFSCYEFDDSRQPELKEVFAPKASD